jgi:hypothetical protein
MRKKSLIKHRTAVKKALLATPARKANIKSGIQTKVAPSVSTAVAPSVSTAVAPAVNTSVSTTISST